MPSGMTVAIGLEDWLKVSQGREREREKNRHRARERERQLSRDKETDIRTRIKRAVEK